jgi:tRNA A-37 threonylcarbamoyl transferase component Bud32
LDHGYDVYCIADRLFYESFLRVRGDDVDFERARGQVPDGWEQSELDDWLVYRPSGLRMPLQGWKIHASACLDNAERILAVVWDYCIPRGIPFKFIRSLQLLLLRNGKYANRGASGKFVTIYPADEAQFELVLTELGSLLEGQPGPYILSDLRWGPGPLYVRYGGFAERHCVGPDGEMELAIAEPSGRLVPDRRRPSFRLPPWLSLPGFLEPHLAARNAATVNELPYRIERPLHFSNGGGLYEAVDERSGEKVVLKEARPYAGLALDGTDAVARLRRERETLERLAGLDIVPEVRGHFTIGEHHFLAMEFIDATPLRRVLVRRHPLLGDKIDEGALAAHTAWALDVYGRVEAAVAAIHERGVVIGDLHPFNILLRPDGRVALIDFEVASHVSEDRRQTLAAAGFRAPARSTGFEIDRFALASLRLFLFLPLTALFGLDPGKAGQFAEEIGELFPVPAGFLSEAVRVITGEPAPSGGARRLRIDPDSEGWTRSRGSMQRAILASATPQREDRLFPGDIRQFTTGGLNLAYGAAGVLYALAVTGAGRYPDHEEWLVGRAMSPGPGTRLGFYDGLHGVAHVLDCLGRRGDALKLLEICLDELRGKLGRFLRMDLYGGLAGIGLNLLHFWAATGDASLRDAALAVAEIVAGRLGDEGSVATVSGGEHPYAGLLRGSSGPALLFLRLYEEMGDGALLDLAGTALRQDLRRCVLRPEGDIQVNEGWRTMPYLADGSVGIGLVLDDYLAHRQDECFAEAAAAIRRAAEGQFYVEPGLFYGRAGMILYLSRGLAPGAGGRDPVVASHIRRLGWHALTYRGGLAFPGEQLLRLSMDLASGTAGVLLALGAALGDGAVELPFLGPRLRTENHAGRAAYRAPALVAQTTDGRR